MIKRVAIAVIVGGIVGMISSNLLMGLFYNQADVRTAFQSSVINGLGLYFGITIGLIICMIITINERKRNQS